MQVLLNFPIVHLGTHHATCRSQAPRSERSSIALEVSILINHVYYIGNQ